MADAHGSRLVLIAGVCLIAAMVLIGLSADDGPLRYFALGILCSIALLLLFFGRRTF